MSAVSSPQTNAPAPILMRSANVNPGPTGFSSRPSAFMHVDGLVDALDGQRVLGAAVDDPFVGADGVAGDHHPFQHRVGVPLEDRAVHERAGVALVGVADHVLLLVLRRQGELPLLAGQEPAAAAAAQARSGDLLDHLLRAHAQGAFQALEAAVGAVVGDGFRVDDAAVAQDVLHLLAEVGMLLDQGNAREGRLRRS